MSHTSNNYAVFRNFIFENTELLSEALSSFRIETKRTSDTARLLGGTGDSLCSHLIAYFDALDLQPKPKDEILLFFQSMSKFKNLLIEYISDVAAQVKTRLSLHIFVGPDLRLISHITDSFLTAEDINIGSSLADFYVSIESTSLSGDFCITIHGAYTSFVLADEINFRLRAQYESTLLHHNERPDYYTVRTDNCNDQLHKRAAVYDAPRLGSPSTIRRISKTDSTRKIIINAMRNNVLFSSYSAAEHKKIADVFEKVDVHPSDVVIKQGEAGDHFYVVESGKMQLYIEGTDGKPLSTTFNIEAGASFGELALLYNIPRTATVVAIEQSVLWRVDRHTYRYVISNSEKESMEETLHFLREVEVLGKKFKDAMSENDLNLLATAVEHEDFAPGDIIIRQDQPGDCFYIIKSGNVAVCKQIKTLGCDSPQYPVEDDGGYGLGRQLALLHPGDYFGERALLHEDVRQASCIAEGLVTCLSLSRDMFIRLVGSWNELNSERRGSEDSTGTGHGAASNHSNNSSISALAGTGDGVSSSNNLLENDGIQFETTISGSPPPNSSMPTMLSQFNTPNRSTSHSVDNENFGSLSTFLTQPQLSTQNQLQVRRTGMLSTTSYSNAPRRGSVMQLEDIGGLEDVEQLFTLGAGAFGRVRLTKHKHTKKFVVVKIQSKKAIQDQQMESTITNEIHLMKLINHPFVAKLFCAFQDEYAVYMAMEFLPCGDFFSFLQHVGKSSMSEDKVRFYSANVVAGLDALHTHSIAYRDLKPENMVMDNRGYVKLVDLGLAKQITSGKTWTVCGTPDYIAPEVIMNKGHDKAVDYWALGVLIYEMMDGWPPFYDENPMKVYQKICAGKFAMDKPNMNGNILDILQQLLQKNPSKRIGNAKGGVTDICKHKWFGALDWKGLLRGTITAPYIPTVDMQNPKAPKVDTDPELDMVASSWIAEL